MSELKKAPIGTQRTWADGVTYVKTHDNTPLDDVCSPWVPVPSVDQSFLDWARELDGIGSQIVRFKEPVSGEVWLTKEMDGFTTSSGKSFKADDFLKFARFDKSTPRFSFSQELMRRVMSDKIGLNSAISEALLAANEEAKYHFLKDGKTLEEGKKIFLTKEQVKSIKEKVRANYKADDSQKISQADAKELEAHVRKILSYLQQGENIEGEKGEKYREGIEFVNSLKDNISTGRYRSIQLIKKLYTHHLSTIFEQFADNYGIRESFRKKLDAAFSDYLERFRKSIEEEENQDFEDKFGVGLLSDTKTFYDAIRSSNLVPEVRPEDYVGKVIPNPESRFQSIIVDSIEGRGGDPPTHYNIMARRVGTDEPVDIHYIHRNRLVEAIQSTSLPNLEPTLKVRFNSKFGMKISGGFSYEDLPVLEVFEKVAQFLPQGHVISNQYLRELSKDGYLGGDNGYAYYQPDRKKITLSSQCVSSASLGVNTDEGHELASVMLHEIGHSISTKLGSHQSPLYKRFTYECGWSWEQFDRANRPDNYKSTGKDNDTKRFGTKADTPLITGYAHKSPEEAFAEYYSFYTQYRPQIESYLKTGDSQPLRAHKGISEQSIFAGNTVGESLPKPPQPTDNSTLDSIGSLLEGQKRDLDSHTQLNALDSFQLNFGNIPQSKLSTARIAAQKHQNSPNYSTPTPIFTLFNSQTGEHSILDGDEESAEIHYSNKYLRRNTPTYSLSMECYNLLKKEGYSDNDIKAFTFSKLSDKSLPPVSRNPESQSFISTGLNYRGKIVPHTTIEKGRDIFAMMSKIYDSDELKKALENGL